MTVNTTLPGIKRDPLLIAFPKFLCSSISSPYKPYFVLCKIGFTISAFLLHKGIKRSKWNTYEGRYFEAE